MFSVFLCFVFGAFTYCLCCLRRAKYTTLILFEGTQDCLKLCNLQSMCSDDPTHPDLQLMPPFHLVSCEFSPKDPNLLAGQHSPLLAGVDFAATQKFHTVFFYIIYNFRSACSFPFCDPFLVQNVHVPVLSVPIFLVSQLPVPIDYSMFLSFLF